MEFGVARTKALREATIVIDKVAEAVGKVDRCRADAVEIRRFADGYCALTVEIVYTAELAADKTDSGCEKEDV